MTSPKRLWITPYNYQLLSWCQRENLNIWVESALSIQKSLGLTRGKDDKIDSHRIALYAFRFEEKCRLWHAPRPVIQQMKNLLSACTGILKLRKQSEQSLNELKAIGDLEAYKAIHTYFKQIIATEKSALQKVESDLKELIKSDEKLAEDIKIACSVEGTGLITAATIIIHSKEFQGITDPRKMACHAGVAPFSHSSGTSIKGRPGVSVFANKEIKSILHMAAIAAAYGKGELAKYFQRMREKGKHVMSVLNAIRNKIIHRIYACIRDRRVYEKNYAKKLA